MRGEIMNLIFKYLYDLLKIVSLSKCKKYTNFQFFT